MEEKGPSLHFIKDQRWTVHFLMTHNMCIKYLEWPKYLTSQLKIDDGKIDGGQIAHLMEQFQALVSLDGFYDYACFLFGEEVIPLITGSFWYVLGRAMSQGRPLRSHTMSFWSKCVSSAMFSENRVSVGVWERDWGAGVGVSEDLWGKGKGWKDFGNSGREQVSWEGGQLDGREQVAARRVHGSFSVLLPAGIQKGDRVAIYMPMIPELVVAMLACARIGALHSIVVGVWAGEKGQAWGVGL